MRVEISTCVTVTYSSVAEDEFVGRADCGDVISSKNTWMVVQQSKNLAVIPCGFMQELNSNLHALTSIKSSIDGSMENGLWGTYIYL